MNNGHKTENSRDKSRSRSIEKNRINTNGCLIMCVKSHKYHQIEPIIEQAENSKGE